MECRGAWSRPWGPASRCIRGKKVFGFAPSAFSGHALTAAEALAPLPRGCPPNRGHVPVAFITAA